MKYKITLNSMTYHFSSLKDLMNKASPLRSADVLAQIAATSMAQRAAAQLCLANLPLQEFLNEELISAKNDEVTRLIQKQFNKVAFALVSKHTVGSLRDWLLDYTTDNLAISEVRMGLTPEMIAAVCKIMRNQDLISVASKISIVTKFRNTLGLPGHLAVRLQPNHPTDDSQGILASMLDGLVLGAGDAVIGINPASDNPKNVSDLLHLIENVRLKLEIPTQSCILTHVTTQMDLIKQKAPLDLIFQSIAGTEITNQSFGINLNMLKEAHEMGQELKRGIIGQNIMYFETGQGSALSAGGHHGVDASTCEVRAYAVAREFSPFLVNSVVGFIGPEYLYDGKQIIRAGLEDHFCAKLMGLPMGVDICYTNHAQADQNDMDLLLTSLGCAGVSFIMGVPGADDIMLNYQSTSFHDALYLRNLLKLKPAPEFLNWLVKMQVMQGDLKICQQNNKLIERVQNGF